MLKDKYNVMIKKKTKITKYCYNSILYIYFIYVCVYIYIYMYILAL